MNPRTGLILLAASTIFAGLIAIELQTPPSEEPQIPGPPPKTEAEASATPQRPRPEQLAEIANERPLFSPTRRPPEKASPTTAGDPELSDVRLTGIVMENDHRIAIFAITGAKPLVRSKGEYVKEWQLDTILPNEVSLSGPGGEKTLVPKADPNLVRPATPTLPTKTVPTVHPGAPPPGPAKPAAPSQPAPLAARPPAPAQQPAAFPAPIPAPRPSMAPASRSP